MGRQKVTVCRHKEFKMITRIILSIWASQSNVCFNNDAAKQTKNVNEWFGIREVEQTVFIHVRTHKRVIASNLDIYLFYILFNAAI